MKEEEKDLHVVVYIFDNYFLENKSTSVTHQSISIFIVEYTTEKILHRPCTFRIKYLIGKMFLIWKKCKIIIIRKKLFQNI